MLQVDYFKTLNQTTKSKFNYGEIALYNYSVLEVDPVYQRLGRFPVRIMSSPYIEEPHISGFTCSHGHLKEVKEMYKNRERIDIFHFCEEAFLRQFFIQKKESVDPENLKLITPEDLQKWQHLGTFIRIGMKNQKWDFLKTQYSLKKLIVD